MPFITAFQLRPIMLFRWVCCLCGEHGHSSQGRAFCDTHLKEAQLKEAQDAGQ